MIRDKDIFCLLYISFPTVYLTCFVKRRDNRHIRYRRQESFPNSLLEKKFMLNRNFIFENSILISLLISAIVILPTIPSNDFLLDDYWQLEKVAGLRTEWNNCSFDLYCFFDGTPEAYNNAQNQILAWYASPELKIMFCRPFASILSILDYKLFGFNSTGYHIHLYLWYMILLVALGLFLRRFFSDSISSLSLILFTVSISHLMPVLWIAARHYILSAAIGFFALLAHIKWREEKWRPGFIISIIGFTVTLLSSEYGLGIFAFLFCYEVFANKGNLKNKFLHIVPALFVCIGWLIFYYLQGYGANQSQSYLNPLYEPYNFITRIPQYVLSMMSVLFFSIPANIVKIIPNGFVVFSVIGLLTAGILSKIYRFSSDSKESMLWIGLASILSYIPSILGNFAGRSMLFPSIGMSISIAIFIQYGLTSTLKNQKKKTGIVFIKILCFFVVILHGFYGPIQWYKATDFTNTLQSKIDSLINKIYFATDDIRDKNVYVINSPMPFFFSQYAMGSMIYNSDKVPKSIKLLSFSKFSHYLKKITEDTFEIEYIDGQLYEIGPGISSMLKSKEPLKSGDIFKIPNIVITVLSTNEFGPTRIRFKFDQTLNSPEYIFMVWQNGKLIPLQFPDLGESITIPQIPENIF